VIWGGGWIACTGAQTITITDGNGIVMGPPGGISVSAGVAYSLNLFQGAIITGGFSVKSSGSGCNYHIWWRATS
jgi:hypothetical protein